jgi:hypothetical protein
VYDDVSAHGEPFNDRALIKLDVQSLRKTPADDNAQPLERWGLSRVWTKEGFQFLSR